MQRRVSALDAPRLEARAAAGRVPPHDLDAEAAVLSAILCDVGDEKAGALDRVIDILKPEHFYSDANGRIYESMLALSADATPIDLVSVGAWLRARERLAQVGGAPYIAQLADATPATRHVAAHAEVVAEKWRIRQIIARCQRTAAEGYGDVGSVNDWIDEHAESIHEIAHPVRKAQIEIVSAPIKRAFEQIEAAAQRGSRIIGTSTGYERLDDKTAGLHDGDLMIVAARPGMGKTSFVLNLAVNVASPRVGDGEDSGKTVPGLGVAVFSLEMPREQLATRMVCSEGRVDLGRVRKGFLQPDDWRRLTEAASYLSALPIWIDDTSALTVLELRAKVRRAQAELARRPEGQRPARIGLVVVDYLQLMKGDGDSREQEISGISQALKVLAKDLGVPVIALSQLNRAVETRSANGKRPQLSDLRESGAIEQDADTIIFIYRDEYYNPETTNAKGIAELIIAKQRNGPTGKVLVKFAASCTRFDNLALNDYPETEDG